MGGLYIRIREARKPYNRSKIEYAFMLGIEENGRYDHFVTAKKYAKQNMGNDYSDPKFFRVFNDFMDYFGAIDVAKMLERQQKQDFKKS